VAMSIHVAEDLHRPVYRFTDPDCFLSCDNPMCSSAGVTGAGLVVWAIEDHFSSGCRFSDKLIAACSPDCLRSALDARGRGHRWSEPIPVAEWLKALQASMALDPTTTPIGEFAGVG
jgi:hypothetical protein